jgi:hypothetical protein
MPDEFERLIPDFLALARRIFDAGARAERERLLALIQSPDSTVFASSRDHKTSDPKPTTYGSISAPVRDALIELGADSPEGVGAGDLAAYFERKGGGPTEKQVRAALKLLWNTGEANRVSRGRYLPRAAAATPSESEEKPGDDDSPGFFNLAAE